ncbi:hypothetical protein [Prevotella corporis]|uniref:hypothetical protein n=1 Tax=Prevotella corporis TaxID=28128 RepID=UPI002366400B|nr:hypothetical protein [Prevotella corporis]
MCLRGRGCNWVLRLTQNSVIRMEISMSGDYAKFDPFLSFNAWDLKGKGKDIHTSTGKDVNMIWEQHYDKSPFSIASAQIKGSYSSFSASLILTNSDRQEGKVSVHAKVYKDEKVIRDQTTNIDVQPSDLSISIGYVPEQGFTKINYED